ncbi:MAG: PorP/SprF family type IX secretion system membrane protein [Saprospiraceae bacterium]
MKLKLLLFTLAFITTLGTLTAQDIHHTLYNMSPLTLNPALTGAYEGTARAGGIYRTQWSSFLAHDLFGTTSFYVDAPIVRGFRKKDWVGIGVVAYNDVSGTPKLRTTAQLFSASYHFAVNKEGSTMLTLGVQGGGATRFIGNDYITEEQIREGADDDIQEETKKYVDISAGLMLRSAIDDASGFEVGFSLNHINQPNNSIGGGDAKKPMRINVHGRYENQLTDKWSVAPTFLFATTGGANQIALQGWGGYQFTPDYKFNFGAGYRFGRDLQALLGADIKENLRVAASYDINTSALSTVTNGGGGFEMAVWYIFKIYKKPSVKPSILCPQF